MVRTRGGRGLAAAAAAFVLTLGSAAVAAGDFGVDLTRLARASSVHCAFYRDYEIDPDTGDRVMVEGRADAIANYQGISVPRARARQVHTRMTGGRNVTVVRTPHRLHFIDDVAGMYLVTTIYGCLDADERTGSCRIFGAASMRHFDSRVLMEPDAVFERVRDLAEPGFCDHGFVNAVESAEAATAR